MIGIVTTFSGSGFASWVDGVGTGAGFNASNGLCVDSSNNIFVADKNNNRIRRINSAGLYEDTNMHSIIF